MGTHGRRGQWQWGTARGLLPDMGRIWAQYLGSDEGVYSCCKCGIHLTGEENIVSRSFQGRTGQAFLFDAVYNVSSGPCEDRILNTGLHKVADLYCRQCEEYVGWKYEDATDEAQKYKIGKCVLEAARMTQTSSTRTNNGRWMGRQQ